MRQFQNSLRRIIQHSGLKLNVISKTSGVSHTYLTKLFQGQINRPGKDKIASALLALNFSIEKINAVLADYDYRGLNCLDIPGILKNNQKRKIEGNTLALYDHIHIKLLLAPMEGLGGTKILVKNAPSVLFMPEALYLSKDDDTCEQDPAAREFLRELSRALFQQRQLILQQNSRAGFRFETFICRKCLEDYLDARLGGPDDPPNPNRLLTAAYFANAMRAIQAQPQVHVTRIVERCTYFDHMIQDADGKRPKLFFFGRKPHDYEDRVPQLNLQGFTSDAAGTIALFQKETDLCRRASIKALEVDYPRHLIAYLIDRFHQRGAQNELQVALTQGTAYN